MSGPLVSPSMLCATAEGSFLVEKHRLQSFMIQPKVNPLQNQVENPGNKQKIIFMVTQNINYIDFTILNLVHEPYCGWLSVPMLSV